MDVRPIGTEEDCRWVLAEIEPRLDDVPENGTLKADRHDVLADLISADEARSRSIMPQNHAGRIGDGKPVRLSNAAPAKRSRAGIGPVRNLRGIIHFELSAATGAIRHERLRTTRHQPCRSTLRNRAKLPPDECLGTG